MPELQLISKFKKNNDLVLSVKDIRENYLFGINLNQSSIPFKDSDIEFYIKAAQKEIENYLSIKLIRQQYTETLHFSYERWKQWGYIKTTYQVVCPLAMTGFLNKVKQVEYPKEWLTSRKESSDELYHRAIYLVPAGSATSSTQAILYSVSFPQLGFIGMDNIPFYWTVVYSTGFDTIPNDILNAIGKLTAVNLLNIAGNLSLGRAGIASQSISIDGLSQSTSSQGFSKQIQSYMTELERQLKLMKDVYKGFTFGSL